MKMSLDNPVKEKERVIRSQAEETVEQDADGVTIRLAVITCGCGWKRAVLKMFQCLYCNEWFCMPCAEQHFGKTISEYRKENPTGLG